MGWASHFDARLHRLGSCLPVSFQFTFDVVLIEWWGWECGENEFSGCVCVCLCILRSGVVEVYWEISSLYWPLFQYRLRGII